MTREQKTVAPSGLKETPSPLDLVNLQTVENQSVLPSLVSRANM